MDGQRKNSYFETLVKVSNVSKKFCRNLKKSLWYGVQDLGGELLGRRDQDRNVLRPEEFWAVKDVSFELKRGECLGLIGRNGAGKSTLLKMLNGLIKPDNGHIEMRGRIGGLIELGAGFNPILTGRENIYVNASILGLKKKETDDLLERIVDYSELHDFIETPVQYYSSGMKVRLGFAIASQIRPDILLIDEVLAVGDTDFKIKCYNEIYRIIENATVILVSHSLTQIAKVCSKCILLDSGKVKNSSEKIEEVFESYYKGLKSVKGPSISRSGNVVVKEIAISQVTHNISWNIMIEDDNIIKNNDDIILCHGESLNIKLKILIQKKLDVQIGIAFTDMESKIVAQCLSANSIRSLEINKSESIVDVTIPNLELAVGKYSLSFGVYSSEGRDIAGVVLLSLRDLIEFQVTSKKKIYGAAPVQFTGLWQIN